MTKAEFNEAFRKAMSDEFASVPKSEEEIDHVFSDRFEKRMKKLIKAEKSVGWHWVNTAGKRAAVIAAALVCIFSIAFGVGKVLNTTTPQGTPITPAPYVLKEENGKFYMLFSEEYLERVRSGEAYPPGMYTQLSGYTPHFASVAELREAIRTGNFSEIALASLAKKAKNGVLEIPDPDKLYDIVLPSDQRIKEIVWDRYTYYADINRGSKNDFDFGMVVVDLEGEWYESEFNTKIVNYKNAADTIISDCVIEERNAQELFYTNGTGKYKLLIYQLESDNKLLYVRELYCLEHNFSNDWYFSETIPLSIEIYCKEKDVSWFAYFEGFEERPSIEWLTSFGVKSLAN